MDQTLSTIQNGEPPHLEVTEPSIKTEPAADASPIPPSTASDAARAPSKSPSSQPLPSTEVPSSMAGKKKGTASAVKKAPKRPRNGPSKSNKKAKTTSNSGGPGAGSEDDDSDHGPYCLCRGPDDHRWMIFCENCEDWFHGECIGLDKTIGESLIEKFICPNCTDGNLVSIYKKTCALSGCRKASRIALEEKSVFCSNEHAQTWWERIISKMPKNKIQSGLTDQLLQEEFMALLGSGLTGVDEEGSWTLKTPFTSTLPDEPEDEGASETILSDEEKAFLENAATERFHLAEETLLYHKMLNLIDLAQDRRRAAITAGRFGEDICGYDQRLDTICARDAFAAFVKSPEGEVIFKNSKLGDPLGEDDEVRGMCERKRCKVHSGWQKMLVMGINYQIREMASEAAEVGEEERVVREAASERRRRKKAENNWVEVLED